MEQYFDYLISHPAYVHFPIAFTFLSLFLALVAGVSKSEKWISMFSLLLVVTAVSFLPALFSGYAASDALTASQEKSQILESHINFMMWSASLTWIVTLLFHYIKLPVKIKYLWVFAVLLLIISILLSYGAVLGGILVYNLGFGVG